jgi:hypothetical protein
MNMAQTLYASFNDPSLAEKAAGALLDHGCKDEDISIVSREPVTGVTAEDRVTHSATFTERGTTSGTGAATMDRDNDAVNAGQSAWDATKSAGNRIAEGGDRLAAGVADALGADRAEANYEAAAERRDAYADANAANAQANFNDAVDRDKATTGRTDTVYTNTGDYSDRTDVDDDTDVESREDTEAAAKAGISTTTPGDAAAGAAKGAGIGLGVGALAALASLVIPGFGIVTGAGALATAIAGAAGATAAGAVAGGVHGYLKDQGVTDTAAAAYEETYRRGGTILAVTMRDTMDETRVREILSKYGAANVNVYGATAAA